MSDDELSPEMRRRIRERLSEMLGIDMADLPHNFEVEDLLKLSVDSMDLVELVMEIEEEFE